MTETSFAEVQAGQSRADTGFAHVRQHQDDDRRLLASIQTTSTEIKGSQQSLSQEIVAVGTNIGTGFAGLHDDLHATVRTAGDDVQAQVKREFEELRGFLLRVNLSGDSIQVVCLIQFSRTPYVILGIC